MIGFKQFTFVCLDFPGPIADKVRSIRRQFDATIAWKPVVVTLAGSSGYGHLASDQDILEANKILVDICEKTSPFESQFSGISTFEDTDIYFFEFADESPFFEMQSYLLTSGLTFESNPYPFKPHCTIHFKSDLTAQKKTEILNTKIPEESFTFSQLSLISDYTHMSRFSFSAVSSIEH